MTTTAATHVGRTRTPRHHVRRSPGVTLDPVWIDETTFTLAQIRAAREGAVGSRRRH